MNENLETDYLVIGSGAMGMAFTDVLLTETNANVVLVDRHHQPGGHWNDAYPFVRLHQPSAFYGVNSRKLGSDTIDATGWNKGLYELATNSEVCAYFDQVMQQQFLPTGRVRYLPMCEFNDDGRVKSLVSSQHYEITAGKTVDATYMNVTVPSMREPDYAVSPGVNCVPLNALPKVAGQYDRYVVIGAGKTGMDACLFLLKNAVKPDCITWIMPRDSWMLDRANIQPGDLFANSIGQGFARQFEVMAKAGSIDELLEGVADAGQLLRFDESVRPTMYRCATVTEMELEELRQIKNVVRQGRVSSITTDQVVLDQGIIKTSGSTLHVDCTADGLERRPVEPVFNGKKITLQSVRTCQQVFSAAFIGHIEAAYEDEAIKNELCTPVPHPDSEIDFLRTSLANSLNTARWSQEPELQNWLQNARLDGFTRSDGSKPTPEDIAIGQKLMENGLAAVINLQKLLAEVDGAPG